MFSWQKYTMRSLIGMLAFLMVLVPSAGRASSLLRLEKKYQRQINRLQKLHRQYKQKITKVKRVARELAFVKQQASRGGLFGLPARMKLPRIRAKAEEIARNVARHHRRLKRQRKKTRRLRKKLRKGYQKRLTSIQQQARQTRSTAIRRALGRQLKDYRRKLKWLERSLPRMVVRAIPRIKVSIDPLDGPEELRQKVDVIKDQRDRIRNRLNRLKRRIRKIQRQRQRSEADRQLARRVGNMTSEDDLFNEGERNPRVVTGARTSQQRRATALNSKSVKDGASRTKGGSGTPSSPSPSTGVQEGTTPKSDSDRTSSGDPKTGFTGGYKNQDGSTTPKPGNNTPPPSGEPSSTSPRVQSTPSRSTSPSRSGIQPPSSIGSGDPLYPRGTIAQQLEALRRYKKALRQRITQLKKQETKIIRYANKLRTRERTRR